MRQTPGEYLQVYWVVARRASAWAAAEQPWEVDLLSVVKHIAMTAAVLLMPLAASAQSSVKDPTSPYAARGCTLTQHLSNPTSLPADCRCTTNRAQTNGIDACKRPYDLAKSGTTIGTGPSFALYNNAHLSGGFVDAAKNRLVASVYWSR